MLTFTQDSKYKPETVSIVLSFADILAPGDSITGIPIITVSVDSGIDANPSNLLYLGCSVINGTSIEQRFRLGIPGVIYQINFSVGTTQGDILDKECFLAILPDEGGAIPNWLPLWETTQLYPIDMQQDFYQTPAPQLTAGTLIVVIINYGEKDSYTSHSPVFYSGTLLSIVVPYSEFDSYKTSPTFFSGTLVVVVINYSNDYDTYKSQVAVISGTLVVVVISYNNDHDSYQTPTVTFASGTLS